MQLVAYGAQDIYLTGNPQITFFKVVYRRHTNFAMEAIEQTFTGSVDFGRKISCTVDRNGDLVHKMYLEVDIADDGEDGHIEDVQRFGHALVKEVEVHIGGQCIDKHYGEWLELWSQLTNTSEELRKLREMISGGLSETSAGAKKVYIPLQFWFNRNPGLALPLIALQYHEVKLQVFLATRAELGNLNGDATISQICLFCDFIFLDTDERRRFAQVSHEYLIEQLQFNNIVSVCAAEPCANVELRFNHPCKELVWVVQDTLNSGRDSGNADRIFTWSGPVVDANANAEMCKKAKLQLNGHDRFREREGTYFRCVQPYQHHTGAFLQSALTPDENGCLTNGYFYVYSFGLKPEEHQPSGTCNFSRIDNAVLQLNLRTDTDGADDDNQVGDKHVKVYATNYNVLRIMSGMGGLAYSN
jgi:hypothetical protein